MATVTTATSIPVTDDPIEQLYERGVTDGFPVVPPTRDRVERMLTGAPQRSRDELIGTLGPCYGEATIEKVAINAVMAGCKPEYFPVVLAGVETLCDERLCAHGMNVTLFSASPWAIINGPVRLQVGLNCGHNALGTRIPCQCHYWSCIAPCHHEHRWCATARIDQSDDGTARPIQCRDR